MRRAGSTIEGTEVGRLVGNAHELVTRKACLRLADSRGSSAGPPVLELEGEFDLDTVPEIDRFLRRSLGPLYHRDHLVIDLVATTFVDSSFIAFLVRVRGQQREGHKELVLTRPAGQVRRMLGMVGLPNVVPVFESVDDAVGMLAGGGLPVIPPVFRVTKA
jgi:anti-sigma B factor antagonist